MYIESCCIDSLLITSGCEVFWSASMYPVGYVCSLAYLKIQMSKLHEIVCPFLSVAMAWSSSDDEVRFIPRDAMLARNMPQSCVCPSVCLSITSRCSTETAKCRITQTTPHDNPGILVFWCRRSRQNPTGVTPNGGARCRCVRLKFPCLDK